MKTISRLLALLAVAAAVESSAAAQEAALTHPAGRVLLLQGDRGLEGDIEKIGDDKYRISMAVAGFAPDEIELTQEGNSLLVSGAKKQPETQQQEFLHRGIANRSFKQTFSLADHVKVAGAALENGLLAIDLFREVPEQLKPLRIAIGPSVGTRPGEQKQIGQDHKSAA